MLSSLILQLAFDSKEYYWKSTVIVLLDLEYVILPKDFTVSSLAEFRINVDIKGIPRSSRISDVEYFLERASVNDPNDSNISNEKRSEIETLQQAIVILDSLCEIHLAKKIEIKSEQDFILFKYCLTEQGVDIALKLQEHNDNKERFEIQNNISSTMKRNSNIALVLSVLLFPCVLAGIYISYERLVITEDRFNSLENKTFIKEAKICDKTSTLDKGMFKETPKNK